MTKLRHLLALSLLAGAACFFLSTASSSAATIDVVAGSNVLANDGECHLTEAIANINNAANTYVDCIATGDAYGTNDTINLPTGTITLTADLPYITRSINIQGAGMGNTIIDGDSQWVGIAANGATGTETFVISQLTVTKYISGGVGSLAGNLTIDQVEIDGNGSMPPGPGDVMSGIMFQNTGLIPNAFNLTNSYIHSIDTRGDQTATMAGIFVMSNSPASNTATVRNVTISGLISDGVANGILIGGGIFGQGYGDMDATVSNMTLEGVVSETSTAIGVGINAFGDNHVTDVSLQNSTIVNLDGIDPGVGISQAGIAVVTAVPSSGAVAAGNLYVTNSINDSGCGVLDIGGIVIGPGAGVGTPSITSTGGNLSDDNSCSSYFTHPTDQNNVAALAASLSPLADNGGYVPTMALLETSPAVDAGVTVSGLTTDARGQTRPQGNAYDSGAYESPFTRTTTTPAPPTDDGEGLAESGAMIVGILAIAVVMVGAGIAVLRATRVYA
jgi:hypothetical protein